MAFTPSSFTRVEDKSTVDWLDNGEDGDEIVLNRPIDQVANFTETVKQDAIYANPLLRKGLTEQTITETVNFSGRVNFNGGSSAGDDAVAMSIALG
jgi:hypothetical protein